MNEEQHYNAAGEELVDWVDTHKDTVEGPILCTLMLEKTLDVLFFCLGTEQSMKLVDAQMRDKIMEYDRCDGDEGLANN